MKTVQTHIRILALVIIGMTSMHGWGTTDDVIIQLYDKLDHLSSERLLQMGEHYRTFTLQPDSAMVCFSIVANRYYQGHQSYGDIQQAIEALWKMACLYQSDFYDYAKALNYNLQAKELAEKYQCFGSMPFILVIDANINGLDYSFKNQNQFNTKQLNTYKEAFALALEQKNWYALHISFMDMITIAFFHNKEALIDKEMDLVKNLNIPNTDTNSELYFKYDKCLIDGIRSWNQNRRDNAFYCFNKLLNIAEETKLPREKAMRKILANNILFVCYGYEAQHNSALNAVKANEQIATIAKLPVHLLDAYKNQESIYRLLGNEKQATHYHLLYLESKDILFTEQKVGSVQETEFLYQLNKKNEQVREMALREQMNRRILWSVVVFSAILLLLLFLLYANYHRVQKRNRQLYNNSLEILRSDDEKRELINRLQNQRESLELVSPYAPADSPQREGKLDEERQTDLLHRVFVIMETCNEIYSPDFSLPRLAELVDDTRNNVSEAINLRYHTNFNTLLNEYRIKEACRRINNHAQWGDLTIEAIGQSVGFRSRSTFWTAFKQFTGLTPGAYQRQSR